MGDLKMVIMEVKKLTKNALHRSEAGNSSPVRNNLVSEVTVLLPGTERTGGLEEGRDDGYYSPVFSSLLIEAFSPCCIFCCFGESDF